MDLEEIKQRQKETFGGLKGDMYRMPLSLEMEDWLIAEVERLTTSCKAWELQAKGYGKVIDLLEGDELRQLEQAIAYSGARSDIECFCEGHRESGPYAGTWYAIESAESDEEKEMVNASVRYLELRGLLQRHPKNPDLVKPLNMEAQP